MNAKVHKIKVGISVGDFNGIGPEIIMKTLKDKAIMDFFIPIIFGSGKLFSYQKNIFKLQLNFHYINHPNEAVKGKINIVNFWNDNVNIDFGKPTEESTRMAINSLEAATQALLEENIDVLVTAPINKDEMMKHGFLYAGHTPYLEQKMKKNGLMFFVTDFLKVAVSTHHIPLREVAENISKNKIKEQVYILHECLKEDFMIQKPQIALLGLNPHSGDRGVLGNEEIEVIEPAIEELSEEGILAFGPYPADSFFQPGKINKFDAVLAMYHDQGMIPFKALVCGEGVNYTAGMPYIRTSPGHGVAYDIAGKNLADAQSFSEAVFMAIKIFRNRNENRELILNQLKPKPNSLVNGVDEDLSVDEK